MKPRKLSIGLKSYSHRQSQVSSGKSVADLRKEKRSSRSRDSNADPETSKRPGKAFNCSGCNKIIKREKYLLSACDKFWHESCLKCDQCHVKLGELGSTLFVKSDMILCRQDFLDLFGPSCVCAVCEKLIRASEMVMRAKHNVYHLECFACQLCNQRFCVGDQFYLIENKVICQYDYEDIQRSMTGAHMDSAEPSSYSPDNQVLQNLTTSLEPLGGDDRQFHEGADEQSASVQDETAPTFQELTALISKQHHAAQVKTNDDDDDDESGNDEQRHQTDSDELAPVSNPLVDSSGATVDMTSQKQAPASDVRLERCAAAGRIEAL